MNNWYDRPYSTDPDTSLSDDLKIIEANPIIMTRNRLWGSLTKKEQIESKRAAYELFEVLDVE